MPKALKDKIAALAVADRRNMAQWCVVQLEKAVAELESARLKANDPPAAAPQNSGSIGQIDRGPVKKPNRHNSRR